MSFLLGLVLIGVSAPQADRTVLIQYKPPLHKAYRYAIETTMGSGGGPPIKVEKTVEATRIEKGVYTVVTKFNSVSLGVTTDGVAQAERFLNQAVVTQTIDPTGQILTSDAIRAVASLMNGGLEAANAITFSPDPVKPGSSWHSAVELNGVKQEVELKLVGVSREHNANVAKLEMSIVFPSPSPALAVPIKVEVDADTGVLRRLSLSSDVIDVKRHKTAVHVSIQQR